jgi:hypothetical protein
MCGVSYKSGRSRQRSRRAGRVYFDIFKTDGRARQRSGRFISRGACPFQGNLDEAEILAYKASFLAESSRQSIIRLGTALKLAEIAVEKSDTEGWQRAIASMEQAASYPGQNSYVLRSAVEMLRSLLFNQLVHEERVDEWLKKAKRKDGYYRLCG